MHRAKHGNGLEEGEQPDTESESDTFMVQGQMVRMSQRHVDPDDENFGHENWLARDQYENSYPDGAIQQMTGEFRGQPTSFRTSAAWNCSPYEVIPPKYNVVWTTKLFGILNKLTCIPFFKKNTELFQEALQYSFVSANRNGLRQRKLARIKKDLIPNEASTDVDRFKNGTKSNPGVNETQVVPPGRDFLSENYFRVKKLGRIGRKNIREKMRDGSHDPMALKTADLTRIETAYNRYADEKGMLPLQALWEAEKDNVPKIGGLSKSQIRENALLREKQLRLRWKANREINQAVPNDAGPVHSLSSASSQSASGQNGHTSFQAPVEEEGGRSESLESQPNKRRKLADGGMDEEKPIENGSRHLSRSSSPQRCWRCNQDFGPVCETQSCTPYRP